jgi:putative ABC transport system permease protein
MDPSEPDTVVVSQIAARELWPHLDPIGQQLYAETWNGGRRFTVVGVVSDTGESGLAIIDRKLAGGAFALLSDADLRRATILARAPEAMIREALKEIQVAVSLPGTDPEVLSLSTVLARFNQNQAEQVVVIDYVGAAAVLLATIGLSGFLWYSMRPRRLDLAIRLALGAGLSDILGDFLAEYAIPVVTGLALALLSVDFAMYIRIALVGISPLDPWAYIAGVLGILAPLLCAGVAAAWGTRKTNLEGLMRHE